MRWFALLLWIGVVAAAVTGEWWYGNAVARDAVPAGILIALGVLAEMAKGFGVLWCANALRRREWWVAASTGLVAAVALVVTGGALIGFVETIRQSSAGTVASKVDTFADLRGEVDRKELRLKSFGSYEPSSAIGARLEGMKQDQKWKLSVQCTTARNDLRAWCGSVKDAEASRLRSLEAEKLEGEINALRPQLASVAGASRTDASGDVRSAAIANLFGWDQLKTANAMSFVLVGFAELVSMFGLLWFERLPGFSMPAWVKPKAKQTGMPQGMVVASPAPAAAPESMAAPASPPVTARLSRAADRPAIGDAGGAATKLIAPPQVAEGAPEQFLNEALAPADGEAVPQIQLYAAYKSWCEKSAVGAVAPKVFVARFAAACKARGVRWVTKAGQTYMDGMRLAA